MPEAHPLSHLPYGDATPQERLDVLLTTNGKLERVEQLPPTTETLLRSSRSAVSIGYVMPPSMQRSGMMGSLPMLHTPSKPMSTKRESTRQLAPGIIGLMRRTDHERTSGTGATVPVAEAWLEDMLDLIHVREADGSMPSGGERNGLSRAKLDRQSLLSEGLTPEQVARLHQTLFVHSFGVHEQLEALLRTCRPQARATVCTRFVRSLVAVFERLLRSTIHSELVELLHGMEDEVGLVNKHAHQRIEEAKLAEAELSQTIRVALRRAEVAEAKAAEAEARRQVVHAELSGADASLASVSTALQEVHASEVQTRETLAALRIDFMQQQGLASAEEAKRAERDSSAKATLSRLLAAANASISAHERTHAQDVETAATLRSRVEHLSKLNQGLEAEVAAAKASAASARAELRKLVEDSSRNEEQLRILAEDAASSKRRAQTLAPLEARTKHLDAEVERLRALLEMSSQRAEQAEATCVRLKAETVASKAVNRSIEASSIEMVETRSVEELDELYLMLEAERSERLRLEERLVVLEQLHENGQLARVQQH